MKNEIVITTPDNVVAVCTYDYFVDRAQSELDAIRNAWELKIEPTIEIKPQSIRPSVVRVEIYGVKAKKGMVLISGYVWREIQRQLAETPSLEMTSEEVRQSHTDFLIDF